jgi:hypothetical protein
MHSGFRGKIVKKKVLLHTLEIKICQHLNCAAQGNLFFHLWIIFLVEL